MIESSHQLVTLIGSIFKVPWRLKVIKAAPAIDILHNTLEMAASFIFCENKTVKAGMNNTPPDNPKVPPINPINKPITGIKYNGILNLGYLSFKNN